MDVEQLDAIDNFINDASDQAAAWYSIVTSKPVVVPSAQIAAQTAVVSQQPVGGFVTTPIGSYFGSGTLVLIAGAVVVAVLLFRG